MSGVLIVTGGSRGIGGATAVMAGGRGFSVAVNYLQDRVAAESVVKTIEDGGGRAVAIQGDVSVEADVVRLFEESDRLLGPPAALVNNAGILETQMRVETMDAGRLQRVFATNVIGSFLCAREAVKRMSTAHGGRGGAIVNVSSKASQIGAPNEYVDYAASKGALDTLTLGLAKEVAEEGIRVNAVRAGFIYTEIHARGGEPNRVDRVKVFVPMKRGGTADEVARAILWLLSDEASYTTGSFIDVTGGR
jgi:NAD(P)-dependent dehydrogenase (short-subunit alcohol dehydrogenase family)